jgi:hypothetical protein
MAKYDDSKQWHNGVVKTFFDQTGGSDWSSYNKRRRRGSTIVTDTIVKVLEDGSVLTRKIRKRIVDGD